VRERVCRLLSGPCDSQPATQAELSTARDVTMDGLGRLFIAEYTRVRVVQNGVISTYVEGGSGSFISARAIALDDSGNLFVADPTSNKVFRVARTRRSASTPERARFSQRAMAALPPRRPSSRHAISSSTAPAISTCSRRIACVSSPAA